MVKVCHITSVHKWDDNRIFHKQCASLAQAGFDTHLVAVNAEKEHCKNVSIHSVDTNTKSRINRIINVRKAVFQKALALEADIYQIHDPELLPYALKLKKKGKLVIYDSHEDVGKQILYKSWLGPMFIRKFISRIYDNYEKKTVRKLDGLISVIDEITDKFTCKHKSTLKNLPLTHDILKTKERFSTRKNLIVYVGGLTKERGILDYINAMKFIPDSYRLLLIGKFISEEFHQLCQESDCWERVDYVGFQPIDKVNEYLVQSKIGLSVLHPEQNYLTSLPTKGFEYMAAGVPMIMSNFEYWKPYFDSCALMIEPKNPEKLGESINQLIDDNELYKRLKENCEQVVSKYSWENEAKKLEQLYRNILN